MFLLEISHVAHVAHVSSRNPVELSVLPKSFKKKYMSKYNMKNIFFLQLNPKQHFMAFDCIKIDVFLSFIENNLIENITFKNLNKFY